MSCIGLFLILTFNKKIAGTKIMAQVMKIVAFCLLPLQIFLPVATPP